MRTNLKIVKISDENTENHPEAKYIEVKVIDCFTEKGVTVFIGTPTDPKSKINYFTFGLHNIVHIVSTREDELQTTPKN